ncbi:hydrogenase-2 assembly chaperone [Sodalis sp. dw_96]|uniref:hydrogenase-2 assembly chaperone n=1 Tax=Sodalis sp. dw_96 TaxID=2719794 RepID=UPI001BD22881|nr:hydrogenase-2 assembly chaperone [Sodalis sp. dw_96]
MPEYIPGLEQNPQPLLERLFSGIAAREMRTLPFYRPQIPIRACDFQLFEQQWIGALLTPWMLSLLVLPGPGQLWPRRSAGTRLALALPCGNVGFTLGEIAGFPPCGSDTNPLGGSDACGQYLSSSLMSPLPAELAAEPALILAQQCVRMALALPVRDADAPENMHRRWLLTRVKGRTDA